MAPVVLFQLISAAPRSACRPRVIAVAEPGGAGMGDKRG